eukprot:403363166
MSLQGRPVTHSHQRPTSTQFTSTPSNNNKMNANNSNYFGYQHRLEQNIKMMKINEPKIQQKQQIQAPPMGNPLKVGYWNNNQSSTVLKQQQHILMSPKNHYQGSFTTKNSSISRFQRDKVQHDNFKQLVQDHQRTRSQGVVNLSDNQSQTQQFQRVGFNQDSYYKQQNQTQINASDRVKNQPPFWGTTYQTFYEPGTSSKSNLKPNQLISSYDITQQSQHQYSRYKMRPHPSEKPLDYSKYEQFNQYVNSLNYHENPQDIIQRNNILMKSLDQARLKGGIINPEDGSISQVMAKTNGFKQSEYYKQTMRNTQSDFNNENSGNNQRAKSASRPQSSTARVYSPMTRFKKNLEDNRISQQWRMRAYRAYLKGF